MSFVLLCRHEKPRPESNTNCKLHILPSSPQQLSCSDGENKIWSVNELRQGTNSILLDDDDQCCLASMTLSSDQALR